MTPAGALGPLLELSEDQCQSAARAHDPRFDGVFFIGVVTTRIYCRPICPARVSVASHRRFFVSAAAAERAGFRPCLRCRPELAPGRAPVDAISRLAQAAAQRIAAGALNGRSVAALARELRVSERHLRRSLERELGVSPIELAQTHRLLLAKRLLADTALPITDIAFASGFQSLRRFNTAIRERYRLTPSALRRSTRARPVEPRPDGAADPVRDLVRLTLAYRPPLAWSALLTALDAAALPGAEMVRGRSYARTVHLEGRSGVVFAEDVRFATRGTGRPGGAHLEVAVSLALLPALMPLLARLRQLFDLDAEPAVIDGHLAGAGLAASVARHPGLRIAGALAPFDAVLAALLRDDGTAAATEVARRVVAALGERLATGTPALDRLPPSAERVADAGAAGLQRLGVPARRAGALARVAGSLATGAFTLAPGGNAAEAHRALLADGVGEAIATRIVMRTLHWPDAFPLADARLQRAAGVRGPGTLRTHAERWRPWRAYAALHLWAGGG